MKTNPALSALRHHVTGAIARGEAQAITEIPAPTSPAYTLGPWEVGDKVGLYCDDVQIKSGKEPVAIAVPRRSYEIMSLARRSPAELAANARLIASAPELLEALEATEAKLTQAARAFYGAGSAKALREAFEGWRTTSESARAAIAKARG